MCGFAGVVVWDEKFRVSRETLEKMSARVAHRGPDGDGLYLSPDGPVTADHPQVGLAFRRLAILDLNPRANQPFTDNEGRWLVFNGEIYNFRELRAELSNLKPEYQWRTTGDGEVLLIAYDVWGEKCVEHLNGMFAFAVWDEPKKSLFLARDRMGQKPLYYALLADEPTEALIDDFGTPRAIAFASELAALAPLSWVKHECSEAALRWYLAVGYIGCGATIYKGIAKLQPSWWVRVSGHEFVHHHYCKSVEFGPAVSDQEARASTRRLVEQAVSRQLVADVPLGCFLSGGVDSSVVAAAMKKAAHGGEVLTFSIGFDDPRYDESCYACEVARHLGTRHFNFEVSPDAARDLPALAATYGEPFGDSSALPTHYLSREARRHVKVALGGDGGDELFGGYDRYSAMRKSENLPLVMRVATRTAAAAIPGRHPKSFGNRLRRFAAALHLDSARRYSAYVRVFSKTAADELLVCNDRSDDLIETRFDGLMSGARISGEPIDAVRVSVALDRVTYLPDDLLTKLDRVSMLHALEVRSPFMDHELVQFAAGLTTDQLLKGGPKRMLREAFAQDLPAWVFKRKKMGFAVPIGEWFRAQLQPMLHDHLFAADSFAGSHFDLGVVRRLIDEHEQQRVDHSQRLYALLMLELWWRGSRSS